MLQPLESGCILHLQRLDIELENGNDGRTKKFSKSAKQRDQYETLLRHWYGQRQPFRFPVIVWVIRHIGGKKRLWDQSSGLRGNWKEIEDALVACGWFYDDSPDWVKDVRFFQVASDPRPAKSFIELRIFRVEYVEV